MGHLLFLAGGLAACRACAATSSGPMGTRSKLRHPCVGTFPVGSDNRLRRLEQGLLPRDLRRWPDDAREAAAMAPLYGLVHVRAPGRICGAWGFLNAAEKEASAKEDEPEGDYEHL